MTESSSVPAASATPALTGAEPIRTFDPGSFRDPWGRVVVNADRVYRLLSGDGLRAWEALAASSLCPPGLGDDTAEGDRRIVATRLREPGDVNPAPGLPSVDPSLRVGLLEHERLPWIGYPYEWSFGMLRDAALLQLELLREAIAQGLILRDGTCYNVQFRGSRPVLIDVLSLAPLAPGELWDGYRQFCETTLFPLMLSAWRGINFRTLLRGRLEGVTAGDCRKMLGWRDLFRRGTWNHVILQDWLSHRGNTVDPAADRMSGSDLRSIIDGNARGMIRIVEGLRPPAPESHWIDYDAVRPHYSPDDQARKDAFVGSAMSQRKKRLVWDIGCNTGRFSRMAAAHADCVVAMDGDAACIERLYRDLSAERQEVIVPAVIDLADPPGGMGWRHRERAALCDRARPDAVLALAVVHHLVFRNAIPVDDVVDWLTALTDELVVEFVGPDDVMVQHLMRQRRAVHTGYSWDRFRSRLERTHRILAEETLCEGRRTLVHAIRSCPGTPG